MDTIKMLHDSEEGNSEYTKDFLLRISKRLSGRSECSKLTYRVIIGRCSVVFIPPIMVYPDKHTRKSASKLDIIEHVVRRDMKLYAGTDEYGTIHIQPDVLVPGVYEYQHSIDKKSRRWVRIK